MQSTYVTSGVIGTLSICAILGAVLGGAMAAVFAPAFAMAFIIGCSLSLSAAGVAVVLFKTAEKHKGIDEYASGFARTEEEVREALADIEARKK